MAKLVITIESTPIENDQRRTGIIAEYQEDNAPDEFLHRLLPICSQAIVQVLNILTDGLKIEEIVTQSLDGQIQQFTPEMEEAFPESLNIG